MAENVPKVAFKWLGQKAQSGFIPVYLIPRFPGGSVVTNLPAKSGNATGAGSIPGSERSPEVENGNLFQYSCLENSMERKAWQVIDHGVAKSQKQLSTHAHTNDIQALGAHTEYGEKAGDR